VRRLWRRFRSRRDATRRAQAAPSPTTVHADAGAAQPGSSRRLRVVTYNVHKCSGMDRRCSPGRIADVLREIDADVIALQEVMMRGGSAPEHDQARFIADALGFHLQRGANRVHRGADYGNVVLSRFPLRGGRNHDISVAGHERRGCMRADVELAPGRVLHVFNLHLGVSATERRKQGRALVEDGIIETDDLAGPRVVVGDFNDWRAELTPRLLAARLNSIDIRNNLRRSRTYPGLLPLTHLDHIYFDDGLELENVVLHRTRRTLVASDHLPLAADFRVGGAAGDAP
jgi:endonuclease/exonuclease/phosphatase family metal-dependent hydrolase